MKQHFTTKQILLACFSFAFVSTLSFLLVKNMHTADATMDGFKAGNIISDYVMGNYKTMSESQIQSFLNSKNACNKGVSGGNYVNASNDYGVTYNYAANYSGKTYHYHTNNSKYICLGGERFNSETAAHIIYRAAQDYRINPQVLLVLLQKEQSLITDQWPNTNFQYRSATGYGCPDTAPCNSEYYGFKNQVRKAAELFRIVLDNDYNPYHSGRTAYVQYNPNPNCGGSNIYIENRATAALYRYTPYQPGGSGSCAAYGNRNFYDYFTNWFGDTRTGDSTDSIVEATYVIKSAVSKNMAIDIDGGTANAQNGTNVQLYQLDGTAAQEWRIIRNSDHTYTVKNPTTNKVLDLDNANTANGTNVKLYQSNGSCAQKWYIERNSDNTFTFLSVCSSSVALDLSGASAVNGANIQIYESNKSAAQKWILKPIRTLDDNIYRVSSKLSDAVVVDIAGGSGNAKNGTNVQIYKGNTTNAQTWKLTYDDNDGFYSFLNPASNKVLDVKNGSTANGANVQLYSANGSCAQKWQITKNSDGSYSFFSACSSKALDIKSGSTANGANIQIYSSNKSGAQKWTLSTILQQDIFKEPRAITSKLSSSKAVDISGNKNLNGTNIQIYNSNQTAAQTWEIIYSKGYYSIKNPATQKSLDVKNGSTANGANVQLYSSNNGCAQKWQITKNSDGSYSFFSSCSGKALDIKGGSIANGANVQIYSSNKSSAQKWNL